ncbi:uncharacterized protein ACWYII_010646 isoform 2-T2 [Salvelinus alpinus]
MVAILKHVGTADWDRKLCGSGTLKSTQSTAKKALNHNIKHVMKEGWGQAGKALMINTDKFISTVQALGVARGAAKAAQAISVTALVMYTLFLALNVFLALSSLQGTAPSLPPRSKDLQNGLLELNNVKTQLQKTRDGIKLEDVKMDDGRESDPVRLAQLDKKLDKKFQGEDKKGIRPIRG